MSDTCESKASFEARLAKRKDEAQLTFKTLNAIGMRLRSYNDRLFMLWSIIVGRYAHANILGDATITEYVCWRKDMADFVIWCPRAGAFPDAESRFDSGFEMLDELGHRYPEIARKLAEPMA